MGTWYAESVQLLRIGLPVIFVNTTLVVMHTTDAWMVGLLGIEELAAITPPALVVFMLQSMLYGGLSASTTFVSQSLGRHEAQDCGNYAWQGLYLGIASACAMLLLHPLGGRLFSAFANESLRVQELQIQYFDVILFSLAATAVTFAISNFFIGIQRSAIVIVGSTVALLVNVGMNYGFIFGAFGLPELGFVGAAMGTVVATTAEAVVLLVAFLLPRQARRYGTHNARPSLSRATRMLRMGFPAGVQSGLEAASWGLLISWLVAFFGTAHQAAATVMIRCMQLSFHPADGVAQASLTLVGHAAGAGQYDLAERRARLGFRVVALYMTTLGLLFVWFREPLMQLFSDDPEVIALGASALLIVGLMQFFDAMNVTYIHVLQGVGDTLWPLGVNAILSAAILAGGGLAVVKLWPALGSLGIWALAAVYIVTLGLAFRYRWASGRWKRIDLFA